MRTLLKSLVFVLALVPLGWLAFTVLTGRTGPNPAEVIILTTGICGADEEAYRQVARSEYFRDP